MANKCTMWPMPALSVPRTESPPLTPERPLPMPSAARHAFVTGATGFLGRNLVEQLAVSQRAPYRRSCERDNKGLFIPMQDHNQWQELMARLAPICRGLTEGLVVRVEGDVTARIAHALFKKGFETHRAIAVLYAESLPIQAQVLVRVLVEVRIDLELFLLLTAVDPLHAARRVTDAMMLEKVRQQRQSDFRGHELVDGAPTPEVLLALEKKLVEQYGKTVAMAMRRHGFSGLSVEDRAKTLGLSDLYNVVYRNFSRNVHGTDYMEHMLAQGMGPKGGRAEYEDLRDHVALSTAITCLWQMACKVNNQFGYGLDEELKETWEACRSFGHWVSIPKGG